LKEVKLVGKKYQVLLVAVDSSDVTDVSLLVDVVFLVDVEVLLEGPWPALEASRLIFLKTEIFEEFDHTMPQDMN